MPMATVMRASGVFKFANGAVMMASGRIISAMAKEYTDGRMVLFIKADRRMISVLVKDLIERSMGAATRANDTKARDKAMDRTVGQMGLYMTVSMTLTLGMGRVVWRIPTVAATWASGRRANGMVRAYTRGPMGVSMRVNGRMISVMVTVLMGKMMGPATKRIGESIK